MKSEQTIRENLEEVKRWKAQLANGSPYVNSVPFTKAELQIMINDMEWVLSD